jgi:hypothetical protein
VLTMSNVIPINDAIKITYVVDEEGNSGISHDKWPVNLMRLGNDVGFVDKNTGEITEQMNANTFNSILYYWLAMDAPELIGVDIQ